VIYKFSYLVYFSIPLVNSQLLDVYSMFTADEQYHYPTALSF